MNAAIDILRHLFAIAVITQHMPSTSRYSPATNQQLANVVSWIDGAVMGFFLISGFLFKPPISLPLYCRKQAIRLLVPFFVFSVLYSIIMAALGKGSLVEGLEKTALLQGSGMQLYYLPYLLLVTIVFATMSKVLHGLGMTATGLAAGCSGVLALTLPTASPTGSDIRLIPLYFCSFLIGAIVSKLPKQILQAQMTVFMAALMAAVGFWDVRFFGLAGVIALLGAALILGPRLPHTRLPGSGGIYLLHTPIINFTVSTVLLKVSIEQSMNVIVSVFLTYLICLALTLILIKYFPRRRWIILE